MVTENARNDVWQNFLDVSRLVLYYDVDFKCYQRYRYTVRFFQILPLLRAVTLVFSEFPNWVQAVGLLIAIAVGNRFKVPGAPDVPYSPVLVSQLENSTAPT